MSKDVFRFVWDKEAIRFQEGGEIRRRFITSIESIKVCPPPNRSDLGCFIHGSISFTDDPDNAPVTLFDHSEDDPESIVLGHPDFGFLTLSDGDSDRLLCAKAKLIFVNLNLFEEHVEIANAKNFKYEISVEDESVTFEVETQSKFTVQVTCNVVYGVRVQVEVTRATGDSHSDVLGKRDYAGQKVPKKIPMWGHIAACQHFKKGDGKSSMITMNYRFDNEPIELEVGSAIPLDRKIVVAPAGYKMFLSVALALAKIESKEVPDLADDSVAFPIDYLVWEDNPVDRQLTYTKPVPGTMFSVSITFIH